MPTDATAALQPGDYSLNPGSNTVYNSITISGKISDLSTKNMGSNLKVCAYVTVGETSSILGSGSSDSSGSYNIVIPPAKLTSLTFPYTIKLSVFQVNTQLTLDKEETLEVSSLAKSINVLKHPNVYTLPVIKGLLRRKNNTPAAGCLVELFNNNDLNTRITYATTDINGKYEIPYPQSSSGRSNLRLKFYNNEDFTESLPIAETPAGNEESITNASVILNKNVTIKYFEGDIILESKKTFGQPIYDYCYKVKAISGSSPNWTITKELLSIIDDDNDTNKKYWIIKTLDNGTTYKKVLNYSLVIGSDLKSSTIYKRNPTVNPVPVETYQKVTRTFKPSKSPLIVTNKWEETVNFRFSADSLDLYTRLTLRESELIEKEDPNNANLTAIPKRSNLKGYKLDEISYVASTIGGTNNDIHILGEARNFNSALHLNEEALLFGLLKMGVKPTIADVFAISEYSLNNKLLKAISQKIIPDLADLTVSLLSLRSRINHLVQEQFGGLFNAISDTVIAGIRSNQTKQILFVSTLIEYSYDNKPLDNAFWSKLTSYTEAEKGSLKLAVQYSDLCYSNDLFINLFVASGTLLPINVLLAKSKANIVTLINANPGVLTLDYLPENLLTANAFAEYINEKIETNYSTRSLMLRLSGLTDFSPALAESFNFRFNAFKNNLISANLNSNTKFYDLGIINNIPFELSKDIARDYIEVNNSIFNNLFQGISGFDKEDWIEILTLVQRLYSLTGKNAFDAVYALISNQYYSAYDIVIKGKTKFFDKLTALSESDKNFIYNAAELKVNNVLATLNKYSSATNNLLPSMVESGSPEPNTVTNKVKLLTLPQMSTLFGQQDVTESDHSESVLGAAAYLVDILNLMKRFDVDNNSTLYDRLIQRRPDLAHIPLNCKNTLTILPHIDLVIELLESYIIPKTSDFNTIKDFDELKAEPDHVDYNVYTTVNNRTINSWNRTSLDIKNEELRIYFNAIGFSRPKVSKNFNEKITNCVNPHVDILGLNFVDLNYSTPLITIADSVFNSLSYSNGSLDIRVKIHDLLDFTELTLSQLIFFLESYYINPIIGSNNERHTIHYSGKIELENAYLQFVNTQLATEFLKRFYQYQRLLKITGWNISVLDAVIFKININAKPIYSNGSATTNPFLVKADIENIGKLILLQKDYGWSNNQVAGLFGAVKVLDYPTQASIFNQIFIDNKELSAIGRVNFTAFANQITASDTYSNSNVYLSNGEFHPFIVYLQTAMGLSASDIRALLYFINETAGVKIIDREGVLKLVRAWQMNQTLGITYEQLVALCKLSGDNSLNDVQTYIDALVLISGHNLDVFRLLYYFNHSFVGDNYTGIATDAELVVAASNIRDKKISLNIQAISDNSVLEPFVTFIKSELSSFGNFAEELLFWYTNKIADECKILDSISLNATTSIVTRYYKSLLLSVDLGLTKSYLETYLLLTHPPVTLFSLPTTETTVIKYAGLKKLVAIIDSKPFLVVNANPFEFYQSVSTKTKTAFDTENNVSSPKYFDWYAFTNLWTHNQMLSGSNYNSDLTWFVETGRVYSYLLSLGCNFTEALGWLKWQNISDADLSSIKEFAKKKLGTSVYIQKVSQGRNALRIKQRDTLVQYLLEVELAKPEASRQFNSANDLYAYFLIDTQMTPVVNTSRIVQATLTVQTFMKRIQLGLETDISITKEDEKHWEWMSMYRVWEANRKIFLYPENWLEPELRDNKTPFFKELEKELLSNDITPDSIENAYLNYMSKLEKISNLEYCQMFNQEIGSYSVLHVFGRTKHDPKEYFYRKLINEAYWTPWEKVNIELNSDHLAPVVIKDRLVLFWLEFTDESKEPGNDALTINPDSPKGSAPIKSLKINICWSEFIANKWTSKKMATDSICIENVTSNEKSKFRFVYADGNLFIHALGTNWGYGYGPYAINYFNDITITKVNFLIYSATTIPAGLAVYGQKMKADDLNDNITLPIASDNGIASPKLIVDPIDSSSSVVFPHQYQSFSCQSPFVIENQQSSLILVPVVRPDKSSTILNQVAQSASQSSATSQTSSRSLNRPVPDFYTDEHQDLSLVNDTPDEQPVIFTTTSANKPTYNFTKNKSRINAYLGYHPYIGELRGNIQKFGIRGILDPGSVIQSENVAHVVGMENIESEQSNKRYLENFVFNKEVVLNLIEDSLVPDKSLKYLAEAFEFNVRSAYGIYNWELFFHIPYLMANHFNVQGNYDEALKWMHYIFDPRVSQGEVPGRYWKFKPFADYHSTESIDDLLGDLSQGGNSVENSEFNDQIEIWSNDPFKPHNIAQIRISAYMKSVVMKYLDILIARGDESFRFDTMESINEALLFYITGAQILGKKPEVIKVNIEYPLDFSAFNSDTMGNAMVYSEELVIKPENAAYIEKYIESREADSASKPNNTDQKYKNMVGSLFGKLHQTESVYRLYFSIPKNDKMFSYWDIVADRLFKIRNSMNIDGVQRTLDLFAPPIDPGLLARAAAAGVSITEAFQGTKGSGSQYRFTTLLQRATEMCSEVKSLGAGILSALEKQDSESFTLLKTRHEIALNDLITLVKEKSIEEAQFAIENLEKVKESTKFRQAHYKNLKRISKKEQQQLDFAEQAMSLQVQAQVHQMIAGILGAIPMFHSGVSGFGGSPNFTFDFGGPSLAGILQTNATIAQIGSTILSHKASTSSIMAGYERRTEEWDFQVDMATKELEQIEKQILSAKIRKEMVSRELVMHQKQIEQSQESYDVLSTKFTNKELYLWMATELGKLHKDAFSLAYNLAKYAEDAYNYELLPASLTTFITNDYYTSQYKGLLAGERLFLALKNMENSYLESNDRKHELTKHISLAMLDPQQILALRSSGSCTINLPEILFDLDHPGHYKRRIKSVALSIPCVAGPYTSVAASLTLNSNSIRYKNTGDYAKVDSDSRFKEDILTGITIATSSSMNDNGMFELNFNDARYLPFEGAGVISEWTMTLPNTVRQFDYNTITDVIMHIQYTAESGIPAATVESYISAALNNLVENNGLNAMFSLKHQFPEAWAAIKNGSVTIEVSKSLFPYFLQQRTINISGVTKNDVTKTAINSVEMSGITGQLPKSIIIPQTNNSAMDDIIILVKYTVS